MKDCAIPRTDDRKTDRAEIIREKEAWSRHTTTGRSKVYRNGWFRAHRPISLFDEYTALLRPPIRTLIDCVSESLYRSSLTFTMNVLRVMRCNARVIKLRIDATTACKTVLLFSSCRRKRRLARIARHYAPRGSPAG